MDVHNMFSLSPNSLFSIGIFFLGHFPNRLHQENPKLIILHHGGPLCQMNQIKQDLGTSCTMMHDLVFVGSKWCNKQNIDFGWCKIVHYELQILHEKSSLNRS